MFHYKWFPILIQTFFRYDDIEFWNSSNRVSRIIRVCIEVWLLMIRFENFETPIYYILYITSQNGRSMYNFMLDSSAYKHMAHILGTHLETYRNLRILHRTRMEWYLCTPRILKHPNNAFFVQIILAFKKILWRSRVTITQL